MPTNSNCPPPSPEAKFFPSRQSGIQDVVFVRTTDRSTGRIVANGAVSLPPLVSVIHHAGRDKPKLVNDLLNSAFPWKLHAFHVDRHGYSEISPFGYDWCVDYPNFKVSDFLHELELIEKDYREARAAAGRWSFAFFTVLIISTLVIAALIFSP